MEASENYKQFKELLVHIRLVTNEIGVIFNKIDKKWLTENNITYAMPDVIEQFQQ